MDVNLIHGKNDYILLVLHHLIVDGVSWNILLLSVYAMASMEDFFGSGGKV